MARRTVLVVDDDLNGGPAAEQPIFSIDGVSYEIDLNESNARQLRDLLAPYVAAGRRARNSRSVTKKPVRNSRQIREWARANGHQIANQGRTPPSVPTAYARGSPPCPAGPRSEPFSSRFASAASMPTRHPAATAPQRRRASA